MIFRLQHAGGVWASFAEICYYGIIFLTSVVVARNYGAVSLGQYSLNFFLASILVNIGNSGFTAILRKKLACTTAVHYPSLTQSYLFFRFLFGFLVFIFGVIYLCATQIDNQYMVVVFIPLFFSRYIDGLSEISHSVFIVEGRFLTYFCIKFFYCICCIAAMIFCVINKIDVLSFYWMLSVASLLMFLVSGKLYDDFVISRGAIKKIHIYESFKESWPLLINAVIFALYARYWIFYADSIFQKSEVAVISAAMSIVSAIALVPNSIGTVMFPKLCRLANYSDRQELKIFVVKMSSMMMAAGGFMAIAVFISAPLTPYVFGMVGIATIPFLKILSLSLVPTFVIPTVGYLSTAIGKQKVGLFIATATLVVSIPIYHLAVAYFSVTGIVWAYSLLQFLMLIINVVYFIKWFSTR